MQWGWNCPYAGVVVDENSPPPCRKRYGADGEVLPGVEPSCVVAPWFSEEGVAYCLHTDGATFEPSALPVQAEYAWFGHFYRWRPVQLEEVHEIKAWDGTVIRRIVRPKKGAAQ